MPKLYLTVKANAKENRVIAVDETHFRVWVKSPPHEGRANEDVIRALSGHFGFPKSRFAMLAGHQSKNKIVAFDNGQPKGAKP